MDTYSFTSYGVELSIHFIWGGVELISQDTTETSFKTLFFDDKYSTVLRTVKKENSVFHFGFSFVVFLFVFFLNTVVSTKQYKIHHGQLVLLIVSYRQLFGKMVLALMKLNQSIIITTEL